MSETTLELAEPTNSDPASRGQAGPALQRHRPSLTNIVPNDAWFTIRLIGFGAFAVAYVIWFIREGVIIDRISVGISVFIFIIIGHLGRPMRRWAWLLFDCLCYSVMWFCYEESRGWADRAGFELQVQAPRNIDRFLFFGNDPNVVLQRHFYDSRIIHWYDRVASATYFTHFVFPVIAIAVLWVSSHREWAANADVNDYVGRKGRAA